VAEERNTASAVTVLVGRSCRLRADPFLPFRARPKSLKRRSIARIPTFSQFEDLP